MAAIQTSTDAVRHKQLGSSGQWRLELDRAPAAAAAAGTALAQAEQEGEAEYKDGRQDHARRSHGSARPVHAPLRVCGLVRLVCAGLKRTLSLLHMSQPLCASQQIFPLLRTPAE